MAIAAARLAVVPREIPKNLQPINEAAGANGLAVETLYRWMKTRGLRRIRLPGDRRTFVDRDQLAELLKPEEK
jgi:predicted site-specific integrase-resolvase